MGVQMDKTRPIRGAAGFGLLPGRGPVSLTEAADTR